MMISHKFQPFHIFNMAGRATQVAIVPGVMKILLVRLPVAHTHMHAKTLLSELALRAHLHARKYQRSAEQVLERPSLRTRCFSPLSPVVGTLIGKDKGGTRVAL